MFEAPFFDGAIDLFLNQASTLESGLAESLAMKTNTPCGFPEASRTDSGRGVKSQSFVTSAAISTTPKVKNRSVGMAH